MRTLVTNRTQNPQTNRTEVSLLCKAKS